MLCASAVTARHFYGEMLINRCLVQTKGKALCTEEWYRYNPCHYSATEFEARRDYLKGSKKLRSDEGEHRRRGEMEHAPGCRDVQSILSQSWHAQKPNGRGWGKAEIELWHSGTQPFWAGKTTLHCSLFPAWHINMFSMSRNGSLPAYIKKEMEECLPIR